MQPASIFSGCAVRMCSVLLLCVLLGFPLCAREPLNSDASKASVRKINIAVLKFDAEGVTESEASILRNKVESDLTRANNVSVLEREEMDRVLAEQGFQQSGACDATGCQVELGRILSVDRMILGVVGRLGEKYTLSLKMVDVETGRIVVSQNSDAKDEISDLYVQSIPTMLPQLFLEDARQKKVPQSDTQQNDARVSADEVSPAGAKDSDSEVSRSSEIARTSSRSGLGAQISQVGHELKSILSSTRSGTMEEKSLEEIIIASRGKSERAAFWWSVGTLGMGGGNFYATDYLWGGVHFVGAVTSSGIANANPGIGAILFVANAVWSVKTSRLAVQEYNRKLVEQKVRAQIHWIQDRPVPVLVMHF